MNLTQFINSKYQWVGHLYHRRYCTDQVHEDEAILFISQHQYLNPVRVGMLVQPEDKRWISYHMFIGLEGADLVIRFPYCRNWPRMYTSGI